MVFASAGRAPRCPPPCPGPTSPQSLCAGGVLSTGPRLPLVDGRTHVERIEEIKLSFPNKGARCSPRRGQRRQGPIRAWDVGRAGIPATMSTSSTARWTSGTGETFCDIQVVGPGRGSPPTAGQRGKAALRRRLSGPSSRRTPEQPEEGASSETGRAGGRGCGSTPVRLFMERTDYGGPSYPCFHGQAGKANARPSCEGCVDCSPESADADCVPVANSQPTWILAAA